MKRDSRVMAPVLADIAKATGFSKATVSRALGENPHVTDSTRQAIRAAAERLGWRPTPEFAALARRRWTIPAPKGSGVMGFWSTGGEAILAQAFTDVCQERGYIPFIMDGVQLGGRNLNEVFASRGVRGVVCASIVDGSMSTFDLSEVACVVVGSDLPDWACDRVCHDWEHSVLQCVRKALAGGYRRFGFTSLPYAGAGTRHALQRAHICGKAEVEAANGYLAPLLTTSDHFVTEVAEWIHEHELDVVISDVGFVARHAQQVGMNLGRKFGVAALQVPEDDRALCGVVLSVRRHMECAVSLVHEALSQGSHGPVESLSRLLVSGPWMAGSSL